MVLWPRTFVAPLERLKLEYIVRGERKNLFELIRTIGATQGVGGFWKGNFVNILRTAPFKAINFYAYDTYRNHLCKLSGNEEATNIERFIAGAAAGITATLLCLPMDTVCGNQSSTNFFWFTTFLVDITTWTVLSCNFHVLACLLYHSMRYLRWCKWHVGLSVSYDWRST